MRVPAVLAPPAEGTVQVWWALLPPAGLEPAAREALAADVDPRTLARLARMRRFEDRDRGLAGHALMRRLLAATLGGTPAGIEFTLLCGSCGSTEHGKPRLPGDALQFNLSHSGRVVAVALAPPGAPVGVDVEQGRAVRWATLRRSVFGDEEWAATESAPDPDAARMAAWARKEAAVKATGHGIALPLPEVPVAGGPVGGWTAELPQGAGRVAGADVVTADGHAGAVAVVVASAGVPAVSVQRATLE